MLSGGALRVLPAPCARLALDAIICTIVLRLSETTCVSELYNKSRREAQRRETTWTFFFTPRPETPYRPHRSATEVRVDQDEGDLVSLSHKRKSEGL